MDSAMNPIPDGSNPLTRLRRLNRAVIAGASALLAIAAVWALWPQAEPKLAVPPPQPLLEVVATPDAHRTKPLDLVAFGAPIWDPMPAPPKSALATAPTPPPPPLKLQLLGIARDPQHIDGAPERFIAAIYDEAKDKVFMLRSGDTLGAARVTGVTSDSVEIADGAGRRRFALHSAPPTKGVPKLDLLSKQPVTRPSQSAPAPETTR